ncbi:MAG: putative nucleotidyltransferase [Limisphaerales bacterium]|jgi:predicted nucleotidyltransferase
MAEHHNKIQIPSAGTQVVSQIEIRGTNNSLIHPRGAVGIITRTPARHEADFLVRFPDGFESKLRRDEFEVLQTFKSQLPDPLGDEFDMDRLVVYECVVGSRAYGLEHAESDTDKRGIYVAPARLVWSLFGYPEQIEDNAAETCYWEMRKFLVMALKANPNILECLYSPIVLKHTPIADRLLEMRGKFLSQMVFQTFNGYAMSQFKKIERDVRNQGAVRWKHAMHLVRLLITGARILREGEVPVDVGKHREKLLTVKRGDLSWETVDRWRVELHADFETALKETKLPERPDYAAANELLLAVREESAK